MMEVDGRQLLTLLPAHLSAHPPMMNHGESHQQQHQRHQFYRQSQHQQEQNEAEFLNQRGDSIVAKSFDRDVAILVPPAGSAPAAASPPLYRPRGRKPKMIYEANSAAEKKLRTTKIWKPSDVQAAQHVKTLDERYTLTAKRKYSYENVVQAIENDELNGDKLLEVLLKRGIVNADTCNATGYSLLHWAASREFPFYRTRAVEMLLERGASVDVVETLHGRTPLHLAALAGNSVAVVLLLRKGAKAEEPDASELMQTALHLAAESGSSGSVKAAQELLKWSNGFAAKLTNANGETPLHTAAAHNHTDIARVIIANVFNSLSKADEKAKLAYLNQQSSNSSNETALAIARRRGSHHMVRLLTAEIQEITAKLIKAKQIPEPSSLASSE